MSWLGFTNRERFHRTQKPERTEPRPFYPCPKTDCTKPRLFCPCPKLDCTKPRLFYPYPKTDCTKPRLFYPCPKSDCTKPRLFHPCPKLDCTKPRLFCPCPKLDLTKPRIFAAFNNEATRNQKDSLKSRNRALSRNIPPGSRISPAALRRISPQSENRRTNRVGMKIRPCLIANTKSINADFLLRLKPVMNGVSYKAVVLGLVISRLLNVEVELFP